MQCEKGANCIGYRADQVCGTPVVRHRCGTGTLTGVWAEQESLIRSRTVASPQSHTDNHVPQLATGLQPGPATCLTAAETDDARAGVRLAGPRGVATIFRWRHDQAVSATIFQVNKSYPKTTTVGNRCSMHSEHEGTSKQACVTATRRPLS